MTYKKPKIVVTTKQVDSAKTVRCGARKHPPAC